MKSTLLSVVLSLFIAPSFIQAQSIPKLINYQGKLTDAAGSPLPNGAYGVAVRVWSKKAATEPGNLLIWGNEYNVAAAGGVFNLILGAPGGTPISGAAVNDIGFAFGEPDRFIGWTVIRGTNGNAIPNAAEIIPRQQVLSTPYALNAGFATRAANADNVPFATNVLNGVPVGTILPFGGVIMPPGFLLCNGAEQIRANYAQLFSVIGSAYGAGNGSTTFHLPDLRGMFLRGVDAGSGRDPDTGTRAALHPGGNSGNAVGSYQAAQFASHSHQERPEQGTAQFQGPAGGNWPSGITGNTLGPQTGSTGGSETRPKNVYVHFIIKAL